MDHCLLVAAQVVTEAAAVLVERLGETAGVAVAEDPEAAVDQRAHHPVPFHPLRAEEPHQRLRRREPRPVLGALFPHGWPSSLAAPAPNLVTDPMAARLGASVYSVLLTAPGPPGW